MLSHRTYFVIENLSNLLFKSEAELGNQLRIFNV